MLRYQRGYIFMGKTFVVNKSDIHNARDEDFVDATALLPTPWPPTNADRIRAMSDEEHAHFLVHVVSDGCPPDMDWDCKKDKDGWDACDKCWERWLRQPAEDKP